MQRSNRRFGFILLALAFAGRAKGAEVEAYPQPAIYSASSAFALKANGHAIPVTAYSKQYDYAAFAMHDGPCRLEIDRLDGKKIEHFYISPLKLGLSGQRKGSSISFNLTRPAYLIVEVDELPKLVLAIDSPEKNVPGGDEPGIYKITAEPYRADANGNDACTRSIQQAIDDASRNANHHGIVFVPAGVYRTASLVLKSNMSLYLAPGSVLRFSGKASDFVMKFHKQSVGKSGTWFISTEPGSHDVRIFGRGTIDADGIQTLAKLKILNHLLVPLECTNFTVDGPILRDSALWGTVIARCKNVTFRNTKHFNHLDTGEDDGIDVCESENVLLQHTISISLDDSYSFKTWANGTDLTRSWPGPPQPQRDVLLDDCFAWSRCFAFKLGAGVFQPQQDITVRNSVVFDSAHAFGISDSYGSDDVRDLLFENVDVERNTMTNLGRSWARIMIDPRKGGGKAGSIFGVRFRDIHVHDAGTEPVPIEGLSPESAVHDVTFERITMPRQSAPATSLEQIGVKQTKFADGVNAK